MAVESNSTSPQNLTSVERFHLMRLQHVVRLAPIIKSFPEGDYRRKLAEKAAYSFWQDLVSCDKMSLADRMMGRNPGV